MGRYRGGSKPWEEDDAEGRKLDPGQFDELNGVFYSADPADFIKMRVEVLSLMVSDEHALSAVYGTNRQLGKTVQFEPTTSPPQRSRERYLRTEAIMIVHHASEALLRLFYAHVEHPECPWLGMSASTDFADFKGKLAEALKSGFNRDDIALVFLGGTGPGDAGVDISPEDFEDAVDGVATLLEDCAKRFLEDAFLYNAVKHGLTAVETDEEATITFESEDGDNVPMHKGSMQVYLHRKLHPTATKQDRQWHFTMADTNPERDLAVSVLISRAIDSLWDVARRRYTGASGIIYHISRHTVEMAIYGPVREAMNLLRKMTSELIKLDAQGANDATHQSPLVYEIPRTWQPPSGVHDTSSRRIALPVREQDVRAVSTSQSFYLPIGPSQSSQD